LKRNDKTNKRKGTKEFDNQQTSSEACGQIDKQGINRQRDRDRETERQRDRKKETERERDRQRDRETERQRDRLA